MRRLLYERMGLYDYVVGKTVSAKGSGNLTRRIESFIEYALESNPDAILVIRDSDDECPRDLAKGLADRCIARDTRTPVAVVCAVREYESWFLSSLESIIEGAGSFPGDPEAVADAKGRLKDFLPGRHYSETAEQTSLTTRIDLDLASANSRSFRRLCHAVEELVEAIDLSTTTVTPNLA